MNTARRLPSPAGFGFRALVKWLQTSETKAWLHTVLLLLAVATAFYMGLIPKRDYAYPLHVDEWIHLDMAQRVLEQQDIGALPHHEAGFHILLAELQAVTGLDWFALFRWLPPAFLAVTVLLTYLVGRRLGCGLESAFLATLIPTTTRFLGPAFVVPVALGILALPLLLFFLLSPTFGLRHTFLCGLTLLFVGITHPTSAMILAGVLLIFACSIVIGNRENTFRQRAWRGTLVFLIIGVPAVAMILWRQDQVVGTLTTFLHPGEPGLLPPIEDAVKKFGVIPISLFVLGMFLLVLRGSWRGLAVVASALGLLAVILVHDRTRFGFQSIADRGWLHVLLLMALIGGYGLSQIRQGFSGAGLRLRHAAFPVVGMITAAVLLGIVLTNGLKGHQDEFYYKLVDDAVIADFRWVARYLEPQRQTAVLRTDLAYAYDAVTRGHAYATESFPFVNEAGRQATDFLFAGGTNPQPGSLWWRDHGVTLIYAPHWVNGGPFFNEPRPGIFVPADVTPQ